MKIRIWRRTSVSCMTNVGKAGKVTPPPGTRHSRPGPAAAGGWRGGAWKARRPRGRDAQRLACWSFLGAQQQLGSVCEVVRGGQSSWDPRLLRAVSAGEQKEIKRTPGSVTCLKTFKKKKPFSRPGGEGVQALAANPPASTSGREISARCPGDLSSVFTSVFVEDDPTRVMLMCCFRK